VALPNPPWSGVQVRPAVGQSPRRIEIRCIAFGESGGSSQAEGFQQVGLHLLCEAIDLIDAEAFAAYQIPELLLSRRSLNIRKTASATS
jgi:hypothetical protein